MTIANIQTLVRFLTNTDTTQLPDPNLLILVNASYERITGRLLAETAGGKWQYGDSNYTTFPDYVADLSNSTAEYDLTTIFTDTPLKIMGAEILDQDGNYRVIDQVSFNEIRERKIAQSEYFETDGRPREYELRENQIVLYPAPDNGVTVTLTAGLKLFYLRTADVYTSVEVSTGTKVPGFPSPWHDIIAYESAYNYGTANGLPGAGEWKRTFEKKETEMLDFIMRRNTDERPIMSMQSGLGGGGRYGLTGNSRGYF